MRLIFTPKAWEDYTYWTSTDKAMVKRINRLVDDTIRTPFTGIGKPEQLRHTLSGFWSRRIDDRHRLVYTVDENSDLIIVQARDHYT